MLYFFVALTVVALGYYIAWPLIQGPDPIAAGHSAASVADPVQDEEVARLRRALVEIDLDHATGKTSDEDWQAVRAPIQAQLEKSAPAGFGPSAPRSASQMELELEVQIARARLRLKKEAPSA